MNIYYIRAAIEAATGIKLTIEQVKSYLVSEGMATKEKLDKLTFTGYEDYFGHVYVKETRAKST